VQQRRIVSCLDILANMLYSPMLPIIFIYIGYFVTYIDKYIHFVMLCHALSCFVILCNQIEDTISYFISADDVMNL